MTDCYKLEIVYSYLVADIFQIALVKKQSVFLKDDKLKIRFIMWSFK